MGAGKGKSRRARTSSKTVARPTHVGFSGMVVPKDSSGVPPKLANEDQFKEGLKNNNLLGKRVRVEIAPRASQVADLGAAHPRLEGKLVISESGRVCVGAATFNDFLRNYVGIAIEIWVTSLDKSGNPLEEPVEVKSEQLGELLF